MEDAPGLQRRLSEHLALDLAVEVTSIRLNVDGLGSTGAPRTHLESPRCVLKARKLLRIVVELQVPHLLLLDTLLVALEVRHEVLDLLDLGVSVRVDDLGQVLHQAEIGTHRIC